MPAQARFIHDDVCLAAAGGKECVVTMILLTLALYYTFDTDCSTI